MKFIKTFFVTSTLILSACGTSNSQSYQNALNMYPEVEEKEVVLTDLFDQQTLYPFDELYSGIKNKLSPADLESFEPALETCQPEMAAALSAYPGYSYSKMTIGKVSTVKSGDPYVFITLYGFLDQAVPTDSKYGDDQYDFLIREGNCEIRKSFLSVPEEEKNKIIGYLLRLPSVAAEIANQEVDKIEVGKVSMTGDKRGEVKVHFGTEVTGPDLGPNTWSASEVYFNLNTGAVQVTPYSFNESSYRGEG